MKSLDFSRYALCSCVAAAMLTGCGGSQPPIGAPGAMPQSSALATHAQRRGSWMSPEASGEDLIYAVGDCDAQTCVLSYPAGKLVGTLSSIGNGICSDSKGNVFIAEGSAVTEYAHGGTAPIATLNVPGNEAHSCAVDPLTNNLAVFLASSSANVAVFLDESGTPILYLSPVAPFAGGYDASGDLFLNGYANSGYGLAELASGSSQFAELTIDQSVGTPGQVQWDGTYITYEDREKAKISQLAVSGSSATIVGTINLKAHGPVEASWIFGNRVIVPHPGRGLRNHANQISLFNYPAGGVPLKIIKHIRGLKKLDLNFQGVTISVAATR